MPAHIALVGRIEETGAFVDALLAEAGIPPATSRGSTSADTWPRSGRRSVLAEYTEGDVARMRARLADEYAIYDALVALGRAAQSPAPRRPDSSRAMPETLILHLGLHKTATTALQDFLAANVKALLRHGVAYPGLARMRSDLTPLIPWSADKPGRAEFARFVDRSEPAGAAALGREILGSPGDIVGGTPLSLRREPRAPLLRPVRRPAGPAVPDPARTGGLPRLDVLRIPAAQSLSLLRGLHPRLDVARASPTAGFRLAGSRCRPMSGVTVAPFEEVAAAACG